MKWQKATMREAMRFAFGKQIAEALVLSDVPPAQETCEITAFLDFTAVAVESGERICVFGGSDATASHWETNIPGWWIYR